MMPSRTADHPAPRRAFFRAAAALLGAFLLLLGVLQAAGRYDLQGDEVFSYCLANNEEPYKFLGDPWSQGEYHDGWLWGSTMRAYLQVDEGTGFDYAMVYKHQHEDVHPPVYYYLLHTVSSLAKGSFSPWLALSVNLVCYAGCLGLLWALGRRLIRPEQGGEWAALALPLVWALLPCTMENLIFMRMYMLLSFWVMLFAFCLSGVLLRRAVTPRDALLLGLIVFLGTQTHYYFYIYGGLLALLAGLWMLAERWQFKSLLLYGAGGAAGVLVSWAVYPYIFQHAADMMQSNGGDTRTLLEGLLRAADLIVRLDLGEKRVLVLLVLAAVLPAVLLVRRRGVLPKLGRADGVLLLLAAAAALSAPVIMKLSGIYSSRYLAPVYPLAVPAAAALFARMLAGLPGAASGSPAASPRAAGRSAPAFRQAAGFVLAVLLAAGLWLPAQWTLWKGGRDEKQVYDLSLEALGDRAGADCVYAAREIDYLLGDNFYTLAGFDEVCPVSFAELGEQGLEAILARRASADGTVWICIPAYGEDPAGQLARALGEDPDALEPVAVNSCGAYYRYN